MLLVLVAVALAACAFGVLASVVMTLASARSALWNIAFAVVIAVGSTALLLLVVILLTRQVPD